MGSEIPITLTLQDTLKIAMKSNIHVILAEERVNQAISRINENRSHLYPQLNAETSQSRQTKNLSTVGISSGTGVVGPFDVFDARVKLSQTIFDLSAVERLKSAQAEAELSKYQEEQVRQDVLALAAIMFIDAKRSVQSVIFAQKQFDRDEMNLKVAQKKIQIGMITDVDVEEAQSVFMQSTVFLQTAKMQAIEHRMDLLAMLGLPVENEISLKWDSNEEMFQNDLDQDENLSLETHPQIIVADKSVQVSKIDQATEQAGYFPKFSLMSDYGLSTDLPQNSSPTYAIGIQASVPLFEGGNRNARINKAKSRLRANQAQLEDTKRQITASILNQQEMIKQAQSLLEQRRSELTFAQKKIDLARVRLDNGIGNDQDLKTAEALLAANEDKKEEAIAVLLTARINLAHARGKIDQIFLPEPKE